MSNKLCTFWLFAMQSQWRTILWAKFFFSIPILLFFPSILAFFSNEMKLMNNLISITNIQWAQTYAIMVYFNSLKMQNINQTLRDISVITIVKSNSIWDHRNHGKPQQCINKKKLPKKWSFSICYFILHYYQLQVIQEIVLVSIVVVKKGIVCLILCCTVCC